MPLKKRSISRKSSHKNTHRKSSTRKRFSPSRISSISSSQCIPSTLKKYTSRPGPPYPANSCPYGVKVGNSGGLWQSTPNYKGVYSWKRID